VPIFKKTKVKKLTEDNEINRQQEESETKISLSYFKLENVFDISQTSESETYLQQKKEIDEKIMKNAEIDFEVALDFFKQHLPDVTLTFDLGSINHNGKKGEYLPEFQHIILYEKTSHIV